MSTQETSLREKHPGRKTPLNYSDIIQYGSNVPGYLNEGEGFLSILIAFVGTPIAFLVFYSWRRYRLRKYDAITYFTCRKCRYQWTVVREPAVKKLSKAKTSSICFYISSSVPQMLG